MDLQLALQHRAQVEEFRRRHRTGLVTLVFTDIVGSTQLKQALGDREGVALIQHHRALVRDLLSQFQEAEEVETAGDSFFIVFVKPSDAVKFSLLLQARLREWAGGSVHPVRLRIGIHIGEVVIEEHEGKQKPKDLYGIQVDTCARVMSLAGGDQILLTRSAFDNARQVLKGEDIGKLGELAWLNYGPYLMKGLEEPIEICEVGEVGQASLKAPADAQKAQRQVSPDSEPVLGWRPALDQVVPNTQWVLEKKLGEGGFGEVWLGRHQKLKERRVFKFCFRADRVRSLKREMTLFRVLKERVGDHPNIVRLLEVYFEEPPFYVVMDHVEGQDLKAWCEQQGGVEKVPLEARLEIVAQIADALQAAHDAGVIHRDVKPGNILVAADGSRRADIPRAFGAAESQPTDSRPQLRVQAKLTDFGIGQVVSEEVLAGVTKTGFTETIVADTSSSKSGTWLYLAPELLSGKPASIRSDIYSLGVVLYQLLVGDFTRAVTTDWVEQVSDPLLRDDLKHCFAGNPQDRFAGAGQLAKNLRALSQRRRVLAEHQAALAAQAKAAYRLGVLRTASIAAIVVIFIGGLAVWAFHLRGQAIKLADDRRGELYTAQMNLAHEAWEEGDMERAQTLLNAQRPASNQTDLRGFEWRYLWKLCQDESRQTLTNFTSGISGVSSSPDRKTLAIASGKTIKLWDFAAQRELATLEGATDTVGTMAFSPTDPTVLASAGDDNTIHFWDVSTKRVLFTLPGHSKGIIWIAFSPDGKKLGSAGEDNRVMLWDVEAKKLLHTFSGHEGPALCVAFSRDGKFLVSGGGDTKIRLWDISTGEEAGRLDGHTAYVWSLAFSPDGQTLATTSYDGTVILWNYTQRKAGPRLLGHNGGILSVAFSPDGKKVASGGFDKTIRIWNVAEPRQVAMLRGHKSGVKSLAFSQDGRSLVSGSWDGTVKFWDVAPRGERDVFTGHAGWVANLDVSPDGKTLASADYHALAVKLWDIPSRQIITNLSGHTGIPKSVAFSPTGKLLASGGDDGVRLWDLSEKKEIVSLKPESEVGSVAFSADGAMVAAVGNGIKFWNVVSHQRIEFLKGDTRGVGDLAFSADGQFLATSYLNGKVSLWKLATRSEWTSFNVPDGVIRSLAFSSDSRLVAAGTSEGSVTLFNVARQKVLRKLEGHTSEIRSVAFAPDSKTLASASDDGTVKLWNIATGQIALTLRHVGPITGVAFAPDGTLMATCGADATARLWLAVTLEEADAAQPVSAKDR